VRAMTRKERHKKAKKMVAERTIKKHPSLKSKIATELLFSATLISGGMLMEQAKIKMNNKVKTEVPLSQ